MTAQDLIPLTTCQKIAIFRDCFTGLPNVYGTYDPSTGRARDEKHRVTNEVIVRHLRGIQPYGVYLLLGDRTRAVVADFDAEDTCAPLQFVRQARHYGISAYVERSKRKGWHAWVFFPPVGVSAAKARRVLRAILDDIQAPETEIFPKHDRLGGRVQQGNFINAPLFGALVPQGRTVFVDPEAGFKPFPDQWATLGSVQRVAEFLLDSIIEINGLSEATAVPPPVPRSQSSQGTSNCFGLPPCAQRMLAEGVTHRQRVTCFRLAVHLRKAGLPQDAAIACLQAWAKKNRPGEGKKIISPEAVVEQTSYAFNKGYRGCGCDDPGVRLFCDPTCRIRSHAHGEPQTRSTDNRAACPTEGNDHGR